MSTVEYQDAKLVRIVDCDGSLVCWNADDDGISNEWSVQLIASEGGNQNEKVFTVPDNTQWQILWIWVEFTSDAVAGNRQVAIKIEDYATDTIALWGVAGATQAASVSRNYIFAPALSDLTAFRDTNFLSTPIPTTSFLKPGDRLVIYDRSAVSAGDDMVVQIQYAAKQSSTIGGTVDFIESYSSKVLTTSPVNLIGYWKLDDAEGEAVVDSSGKGNDGIYSLVGQFAYQQDGIGDGSKSIFINATGNGALVSGATQFETDFDSTAGTIIGWGKVDNGIYWSNATDYSLCRIRDAPDEMEFFIDATYTNNFTFSRINAGTKVVNIPVTTTDWFFFAATWDEVADEMVLYIRELGGSLKSGTETGIGSPTISTPVLGMVGDGDPGSTWYGYGAHFAIWNKVLSLDEITQLSRI